MYAVIRQERGFYVAYDVATGRRVAFDTMQSLLEMSLSSLGYEVL